MGLKASDVIPQQTDRFDGSLFYAEEFGWNGEDDYCSLYAFKSKRERWLWIASASNVERISVPNSHVINNYFSPPVLRIVK